MKSLFSKKEFSILIALVLFKILLHLLTNLFGGYGIFRDEYYYLSCSHYLDWGYVDQPPLSIYLLSLNRVLFGNSLFALRLIPAIAGGLTIFFAGLTVQKLGGKKNAIIITGIGFIAAPILLAINNLYSMNAIEILLWTIATYFFTLLIIENNVKIWISLGITIGLGLLNKISMGFFALGLFLAILFSEQRKILKSKWPYISGIIAFVIFLPYIIWNLTHHLAHLEFIRNASNLKYAQNTPLDFIFGQFLISNPISILLWVAGLYFYFFNKAGKKFRPLGIIFLTVFFILIINGHSKPEYLSPGYPLLFIGGAVQLEKLFQKKYLQWMKFAFPITLMISGIILAPFVLPCLPVETYIRYSRAIGVTPQSYEAKKLSQLPQHYADMFGWENMAKTVSAVYMTIPQEEKKKTIIYAQNYGEAGALKYYRKKYQLPTIISPHNNFWFWGFKYIHNDYQTVIIIGVKKEHLVPLFENIETAAIFKCTYCMPYENNLPIFIARGLKISLNDLWQRVKIFI